MKVEAPQPVSAPREVGAATMRTAMSAIPFVGGAAVESFTFITERGSAVGSTSGCGVDHGWMIQVG